MSTTITTIRAKSPHTQPAVASAVGVAVGVLTLAQAFFASGHLPSGAEVAAVLAGAGLTLGSVGAYIAHHAAWLKAVGPQIAADLPGVEHMIPGLASRLDGLEQTVQAQASKVAPGVDVAAVADKVKALIVGAALTPTTPDAAPAAAGSTDGATFTVPPVAGPAPQPAA